MLCMYAISTALQTWQMFILVRRIRITLIETGRGPMEVRLAFANQSTVLERGTECSCRIACTPHLASIIHARSGANAYLLVFGGKAATLPKGLETSDRRGTRPLRVHQFPPSRSISLLISLYIASTRYSTRITRVLRVRDAPITMDFTTYRNPPLHFDIDEIALERDDVLLYTYTVSVSNVHGLGIIKQAPHIALETAGPITYRDALEYDCRHVTGFEPRDWQLDIPNEIQSGNDVLLQAMTGAGKSLPFILPVLANPSRFVIIASPLNVLQSGMVRSGYIEDHCHLINVQAETFERYGLKCVVYNADCRTDQTNAVSLRTLSSQTCILSLLPRSFATVTSTSYSLIRRISPRTVVCTPSSPIQSGLQPALCSESMKRT